MKLTMSAPGMKDIQKSLKAIPANKKKKALNDAGQIILNATKVGYTRRVSPDGTPWAENPEFYKKMKKGAATLSGPMSPTIGGPLGKDYEFAKVNKRRMANSLIKKVESDKVTVRYYHYADVQKRAKITQYGGKSEMKLLSKSGGEPLILHFNVIPRPHLGISEHYARLQKPDTDIIMDLFGGMVDTHLR